MLISRTGVDEGALYNALGTNLTEFPSPGDKNRMVGSFYLDFAGLADSPELYTNELCWVLADGSQQTPETDQDAVDNLDGWDDDEVESEEENDAGIVRPHTSTTVTRISFHVVLGNPQHRDAEMYTSVVTTDGDATNAYLEEGIGTLEEWLDDQASWVLEGTPDGSADGNPWWQYREYLRWSLHWAIYLVPLTKAAGEPTSDDLNQAGTVLDPLEGQSPNTVPMYGPVGLLTARGNSGGDPDGESEEWPAMPWVRLWEEDIPRYVARGDLMLPYSMRNFTGIAGADQETDDPPTTPIDIDASLDEGFQFDSYGYEESAPDVHARGKQVVLRKSLRFPRGIKVPPDHMLVLHIQSGRARLIAPSDAAGGENPGLVIGGDSLPVMGPKFTLTYQEVRVRARHG